MLPDEGPGFEREKNPKEVDDMASLSSASIEFKARKVSFWHLPCRGGESGETERHQKKRKSDDDEGCDDNHTTHTIPRST